MVKSGVESRSARVGKSLGWERRRQEWGGAYKHSWAGTGKGRGPGGDTEETWVGLQSRPMDLYAPSHRFS